MILNKNRLMILQNTLYFHGLKVLNYQLAKVMNS